MKSMTGFGSANFFTASGLEIHVDIASYNKKQLDIKFSLPGELAPFELVLRKTVTEKIFRGAVNIKIDISHGEVVLNSFFEINNDLASEYVKTAKKLKNRLKLSGEIDINEVLKVPGVIKETQREKTVSDKELSKVLKKALDNLLAMREGEGKELKKDIKSRLKTISDLLKKVEPLTEKIPVIQKERLLNNLKNSGLDIDADDEIVLKEIIIFTDRSDVSEEITRIQSHFLQFKKLLEQAEPVGRAIEFIIQELQREINTLGTKAANSNISPLVVKFKTELEKIREQIQNVE